MSFRSISALAIMFVACGAGFGFADQSKEDPYTKPGINKMFLDAHAPDQPRYSLSEIKRMIHDARTSEDFARLADYFDYRAMEFERKSQEQLAELQRLLALPYHARSYSAQVDRTRDLIKRYKAQARESSTRADAYREQVTAASETK